MLKNKLVQAAVLIGASALSQTAVAAGPIPRIVGGTLAPDHAYPFIVAIEYSRDGFQFCGGTLLTPTKILTAGHCLDTTEAVQIRAGTNNKTISPGDVIPVSDQVRHPKYDDNTTDYDVAIFTLATPVKLSDTVNVVQLPEACSSLKCITGLAKPGTMVRTAGWGATRKDGNNASDALRQVDLPLVSNTTCNSAVGGITSRMVCAGFSAGGKDSCSGDSGGPLFGYLPEARAGLQTGIVSWGLGYCGQAGLYGVYTRISNPEIREFIRQQSGV